jgi:hypothetical protein
LNSNNLPVVEFLRILTAAEYVSRSWQFHLWLEGDLWCGTIEPLLSAGGDDDPHPAGNRTADARHDAILFDGAADGYSPSRVVAALLGSTAAA